MAKLSKKKEVDTTPETVTAEVLPDGELKIIKQTEEEDTLQSADTRRLQLATNLVSKQFNLDPSYHINKFDDKGKVTNLTLENKEFIISVTIKDSHRHGLVVED